MSVGCEIFFACSSVCVQLARKNWPCFLHVGLSLKHRTSTANQHSRHFLSLPRPERSCVQVPQLVGRQWCRLQSTIRSLRTYKYFLFLFFLHITYLHRGADILGMHAYKPSFCVIQTHKRRIFCPSTSLIAALKCAQKKILKTCFQSCAHQDSF